VKVSDQVLRHQGCCRIGLTLLSRAAGDDNKTRRRGSIIIHKQTTPFRLKTLLG
jgi:hypothetical protein